MKALLLRLVFLATVVGGAHAAQPYMPQSYWMTQPDSLLTYVRDCAEFWLRHGVDSVNGGYYSTLDREGTRLSTDKSIVANGRLAYGFSRAFMLCGDSRYLDAARRALDFVYAHGWDELYGGWFTTVDAQGNLLNSQGWNPNAKKWGFTQHYALLGIIAYYEVTHDSTAGAWMRKGLAVLQQHMWDARPGAEGYFADASTDWSQAWGKGFTPTVDAITTNAEAAWLVTGENAYRQRFKELGDIIVDHLMASVYDPLTKYGFVSNYDSDWYMQEKATNVSIGHVLKTAWCLGRVYLTENREKYRRSATHLLLETWHYDSGGVNAAWDHRNGGPFQDIDWSTGSRLTDAKDYWVMEQGYTGPMLNYYISREPIFLQMAEQSLVFFMNSFWDRQRGETYMQTSADGKTILNSNKGDSFKASYHAIELGYSAYLYNNLYYLRKPVTLYYAHAGQNGADSLVLKPLSIQDDSLKVTSATMVNGGTLSFDAATRIIRIPATTEGVLAVTFEQTNPQGAPTIQNDNSQGFPKQTAHLVVATTAHGVQGQLGGAAALAQTLKVSLYTLSGRLVWAQSDIVTNHGRFTLNTQVLSRSVGTGAYVCRIDANASSYTFPLHLQGE
jgi:mannobiose 2-epimerase